MLGMGWGGWGGAPLPAAARRRPFGGAASHPAAAARRCPGKAIPVGVPAAAARRLGSRLGRWLG